MDETERVNDYARGALAMAVLAVKLSFAITRLLCYLHVGFQVEYVLSRSQSGEYVSPGTNRRGWFSYENISDQWVPNTKESSDKMIVVKRIQRTMKVVDDLNPTEWKEITDAATIIARSRAVKKRKRVTQHFVEPGNGEPDGNADAEDSGDDIMCAADE